MVADRTHSRQWADGLSGCVVGGVRVPSDPSCIPGDSIPQGNPNNPQANGELLNANTNPAWGSPTRTLFMDEAWAFGWGNRPSSWEFTGSAQHELMSGISVDVGYFHRRNINLAVQNDQALGPEDFDTFQVQVPNDPRLPNAGQMITLVDQKRVATPNQIITTANNFGGQTDTWNGVDVTIDARAGNLLVQGGLSTGAYSVDKCDKSRAASRDDVGDQFPERYPRSERTAREIQWREPGPFVLQYRRGLGDAGQAARLVSLPYDFQVAATLQNNAGRGARRS